MEIETQVVGVRPAVGTNGFTLVEMMIAITIAALLMLMGASAFRSYNETLIVKRAAMVVAGDVALTRSAAIKLRGNVSLVADEVALSYLIRDSNGNVIKPPRQFSTDSDLPLMTFDVRLPGDSLTFNSRGLLVSGGTGQIDVGRVDQSRRVEFNALGRHRIVSTGS